MKRSLRAISALSATLVFLVSIVGAPMRAMAASAGSNHASGSTSHPTPTSSFSAQSLNLDLSSALRNISAGQFLQSGTTSIRTGGSTLSVTNSTALTAAESMALMQVLSGGRQTLKLSANGTATGGTFSLQSSLGSALSSLVIPKGVTAIDLAAQLDLSGNLVNSGKLFEVSTNTSASQSAILATNIYNNSGALISSVLPAAPLLGQTTLSHTVSLSLTAANDIVNNGTISSAGDLTISAGHSLTNASFSANSPALLQAANNVNLTASNLANGGTITALSGNLNIASQAAQSLAVNNTGGNMQAVNGNINFATNSTNAQPLDINVVGGNLTANNLNFTTVGGNINVNADNLSGTVNMSAANGYVEAVSPNLVLGNMDLTDDPQFYNQGNIQITGNLQYSPFTANDNIVVIASGNITATGGNWAIGSTGDAGYNSVSVLMVAGAAFSTGGTTPSTTAPGSGGDVSGSTVITLTGGTTAGGMIDLNTSPISSFSTAIPSGTGNAGSVTLIAYGGTGSGAGTVLIPSTVPIATSASNSQPSNLNGSVIIIAGSTNTGNALQMGGVTTSGSVLNPAANNGNVVLAVATPIFVNSSGTQISSLTLVPGGGNAGLPIIAGGNNFAPGTAQQGNLVLGGPISAGANVSLIAGGNVSVQGNITLTQAPPTGTAYLAQPTVTISSGGTVTVPAMITVSSEVAGCPLCYNFLNITANTVNNAGGLVGQVVNITSNGPSTPLVLNNTGTITGGALSGGANDNGMINVVSLGDLQVTGGGNYTVPGNISVIELAAADTHQLLLNSSNTFTLTNSFSDLIFNAQGVGGNIMETGNTQTITVPSATTNVIVSINTPSLNLSNNSIFNGTSGATTFALTSGSGATASNLTINVASGGTATIETTAINGTTPITTIGGIYMRPTDGQNIMITGSGGAVLNLETNLVGLNPVLATRGMTPVISAGTVPQTLTVSTNPSGNIYGFAFGPFVGQSQTPGTAPWPCFACYSYPMVIAMLGAVASTQQVQIVSTYTSTNYENNSNQYVIQAAKQLGLYVSAGVALTMDPNTGLEINTAQTNQDLATAITSAGTYGNVVDLVVGNEDLVGGSSATIVGQSWQTITSVVQQAQSQRTAAGLSMPVTTRQIMGTLNPANSVNPTALKTLLKTVNGYIYGNEYAFFDPVVMSYLNTNQNPTQAQFTSVVTNSMTTQYNPIAMGIAAAGITTDLRVGETGWPTAGLPANITNTQYAQWYYEAMQSWSATTPNPITKGTGVKIDGYFESFNEPIKITDGAGPQEPYWGIFYATGTTNASGTIYDLQAINQQYSLPLYTSGGPTPPPPVGLLTNLDLTNPTTVSMIVNGQMGGQFGGTLVVSSGIAVGGNVILQNSDLAKSISQINIPANVTVTFDKLASTSSIQVALTGTTPATVNGDLIFDGTGSVDPTAGISIKAPTTTGTLLNIGSGGLFNFIAPQGSGNFVLTTAGAMAIGGNITTTGSVNLQTTAGNASITLSHSIGQPDATFNFLLNGTGSLKQTAGTIIASTLGLVSTSGSFGGTVPLSTNVSQLSVGTSGTGVVAINNASSLSVTNLTTGNSVAITAAGNLALGNPSPVSAKVSATFTTTNNGNISLNSSITAPTISLSAGGSGNITQTANVLLTASTAVTLSSGSGQVGTFVRNLRTATPLLNVATSNSAQIVNTGAVKLGSVNVPGTLTLTASTSITLATAPIALGNLTLIGAGPTINTSITIAAAIGNSNSFISLNATGTGQDYLVQTVTANTLSLSSGSGRIIGNTNAANLSVNTDPHDTGAMVSLTNNNALTNTGVTYLSGSSTAGFSVISTGAMTVGGVTSTTGNIVLTAQSGQLAVQPGTDVTASNGSVTLNASNSAGSIDLGNSSAISATGTSATAGKVTIFVGKTATSTNTTAPAGVTPVITAPGKIYYGNGTLSVTPTNTFTANGKTMIFSGPAGSITVDGGVNVTAQVDYSHDADGSELVIDTGDCDGSTDGSTDLVSLP